MTIVVGYVATPAGERLLQAAAKEARLRSSRLVVVSVTRGESHVDPQHPQTSALQRAVAAIKSQDVQVEVRNLDQSRDAAEAILSVAEEEKASLLVIGMKKRSPVGKFLLGSTAQRVLLDAQCPVLAIRG